MSDDTTASDNDSGASAEPSMEDILASIRRIIADDDTDATSSDLMLDDDAEAALPALSLVKTEPAAQTDDMMAEPLLALDLATEDLVVDDSDLTAASAHDTSHVDIIDMEEDLALTLDDVITDDGAETQSLTAGSVDSDTLDLSFDDADLDLDTLLIPDSDMDAGEMPVLISVDAETAISDDDTPSLDALLLDDLLLPDVTDAAPTGERVEDELADSDMDLDAIFDTPADDIVPEDSPVDERVIDPAADLLANDDLDDTDALIDALFKDDDSVELVQSTPPSTSTRDTDLDLVKSLMADLTDDSFLVSDATDGVDGGNAPAPAAVAAAPEAVQAASPHDVRDDMNDEGDVMDDILAMTLEDEAALRDAENTTQDTPEDAPDTDEMAMDALLLDEMATATPLIDSTAISNKAAQDTTGATASKSLSQIAADARAEAERVESEDSLVADNTADTGANTAVSAAAMLAGLAGGAALVGAATTGTDASQADASDVVAEPLIEPSHEEVESLIMEGAGMDTDAVVPMEAETPSEPEPEPETTTLATEALDTDDTNINIETESFEETHPMPKAAKQPSDAILDEVTEIATASVFASLNSVVEEKAIVAERGDRIGDLVQEALRPMLKDWLDANLKGIVERAVAKEVKRISSGK